MKGQGINYESLLGYFYAYAQNLAGSLINRSTGLLADKPITVHDSLVWHLAEPYRNNELLRLYRNDKLHQALFPRPTSSYSNETERTKANLELLRNGSLIQFQSNEFRFFHRSLVEYFAARQLFETLQSQYDNIVEGIQAQEVETQSEETGLNRQLIKEAGVLAQLIDRVKSDISFSELLGEIIVQSAQILVLGIMSSYAITILNLAGISFSGQDFRNIQIVGADLRGSIFGNTDLRGANLENTSLQNSFLTCARLEGVNLRKCDFGQKPSIKFSSNVRHIISFTSSSSNQTSSSCIWIATSDGLISLWNVDSIHKVLETKYNFKSCDNKYCREHDNIELHRVSKDKFACHTQCGYSIQIFYLQSGKKVVDFNKKDYIDSTYGRRSICCSTQNELLALYVTDNVFNSFNRKVEILKLITENREPLGLAHVHHYYSITIRPDITQLFDCSFNPIHPTQLILLCYFVNESTASLTEEEKEQQLETLILSCNSQQNKELYERKLKRKRFFRRVEHGKFIVEVHDVDLAIEPMNPTNVLEIIEVARNVIKPLTFHPSGSYFIVNIAVEVHVYNMLGVIVNCINTSGVENVVFSTNGDMLITEFLRGYMIWSFPNLVPLQDCYSPRSIGPRFSPIVFTLNDKFIAHGFERSVQLSMVSESITKITPHVDKVGQPGSNVTIGNVSPDKVFISPNSKYFILTYNRYKCCRICSIQNEIPLIGFDSGGVGEVLDLVWVTKNDVLTVGKGLTSLSKVNSDYTNYVTDTLELPGSYEGEIINAVINEANQLIVVCAFISRDANYKRLEAYSYTLKSSDDNANLLFDPSQFVITYQFDLMIYSYVYDMQIHPSGWLVTKQSCGLWFYMIPKVINEFPNPLRIR